ncbi:MAG: ABC transporter ATP-binding protein [Patescibacteria group bacterium]
MNKETALILSKIKNPKKVYFGIFSALLSAAIAAFIPYIYGILVDIAITPDSKMEIMIKLILLWLILSFFGDWLGRLADKNSYEISTDIANELQIDIFHHLINLPLKFHKEKKIGEITRRIDRGIDDLYQFIEKTIFHFFPATFSFVIALIILLLVEWRLTIILIIAVLSYTFITFIYAKGITKKQKLMQQGWEKSYGDLFDSVLNVETIKSSTNEEFERKKNIKNFSRTSIIYKNWRLIWLKMSAWQGSIFTLSFIAVFSLGIILLKNGDLTPGKLIMFVGYVGLLTAPLAQLADQYRLAKTAINSFKRAIQYLDIMPEKDSANAKELRNIKGKITFENVKFGYKKDTAIIENISFRINPGEAVALVGESGVGKSTLVGLISRYYSPDKGKILIDDVDIEKIKLKSLRGQIAIVPQEVLFFNDTIKNNIRYGKIKATDKEIIEASRAANAHEFIEKFTKKYDTLVGERGIKLSTGQKQRVAIARAILRNPKILILDEATSALDSVSEKLVQDALSHLIKNRTTFIIAHRLSTIQHADKIIVLENGKIAELGKHEELIKNKNGIYRNFWELQTAIQKKK